MLLQPTHPGKMVQVGWNAGPRHARIFGLAKSYTTNIDQEVAIEHDQDVITALTLTWIIAKAFLPMEMISSITDAVGEIGLPRLATRNIAEGTGYRLNLGGKHYEFPLYECAPCEGLLTQNYASYVYWLLF
ncbi:hypothetical protein K438DRAFT_1630451 [Mycena galopus ATCC 62051]|nr:hypothetical protein K438DRAFT_1630451 [Mycena galopus ATCC 62051]